MKRLPVMSTLIVVLAVAVMIGLGVWQLQRAKWKEGLLADLSAAAALPPIDLDPYLDQGREPPPLAFRSVRATCRSPAALPEIGGGRGRGPGYVYSLPCRPGATGLAGRLKVVVGWSPIPRRDLRLAIHGPVEGRLGMDRAGGPLVLTAARPLPPLEPAVAPGLEAMQNNHLFYAFQWFFFALAALFIYGLALRRRRPTLMAAAAEPKGGPS